MSRPAVEPLERQGVRRARSRARALVSGGALAALVSACSFLTDLDRPGARFIQRMSSQPAWSADGRTIYFTDRAGSGITRIWIKAVDLASGDTRTLATIRGLNHGEQLRTSAADPSAVYASVAQQNWSLKSNIYRVPAAGGAPETVTTNVGIPRFVLSASGNRVAYRGSEYDSDTLYVTPVSGDGEPAVIPSEGSRPQALSLSPDGELLLYSTDAGIHLVPVAGGAHRLVWRSDRDRRDAVAPHVLWRGTTPHLLVALGDSSGAGGVGVYDVDGTTGERTRLSTIPAEAIESGWWQLARSRDGSSYAVWLPVAVTGKNMERTVYRFRLYVRTPGDAEPRPVLALTADQPLSWFEFSPDGSRIALLLHAALHIVELAK